MLENRDDFRQSESFGSWRRSATVVLLIINAIVFVLLWTIDHTPLQNTVLADLEPGFTLSLDGLRHGYVWQLLTFQFLHAGPMHLFFNCWALFVFGLAVEQALGKTRYVVLYLSSGVIGGLFQELVALVWPQYFGSAVVGASAGVFGVLSAFAMMDPERRLTMLIFFVIPVNMRAKSLLWINLIITAIGIGAPNSRLVVNAFGNMAHAAHLGGILTGLAFIRLQEKALDRPKRG